MKAFRFGLESVLLLREREEQLTQQEYGRALQSMVLARQALSDAQKLRDEVAAIFAERRRRGFRASDQDVFWNLMKRRHNECTHLAEVFEKTVAEAERRRATMFESKRKHEMVLHLKSKQWETHDAAVRRNEELQIDDLVSTHSSANLRRVAL